MFIIPASEVLLLGAAVVLVLAWEQSFISGMRLHLLRFQRLEGGIADVQVADHPVLIRNFENRAQSMSAHRTTHHSRTGRSVAWVVATLAILGLLTAMLMAGIAISV
jgi:hypothetical protein